MRQPKTPKPSSELMPATLDADASEEERMYWHLAAESQALKELATAAQAHTALSAHQKTRAEAVRGFYAARAARREENARATEGDEDVDTLVSSLLDFPEAVRRILVERLTASLAGR